VVVSEAKRLLRAVAVSEAKRLKTYSGLMQRPLTNGKKCPFGCNGYVTAVAVGQSQRLYSSLRMFMIPGFILAP
jgi:hypothetical protein